MVTKPTIGQRGWGPILNTALDALDTAAQAASAAADAALAAAASGIGPGPMVMPGVKVALAPTSFTTVNFTPNVANELQGLRVGLSRGITIDEAAVKVVTAAGGATLRVGIWSTDADGLPDAVLADSGVIDASTTGVKQFSVALDLPAGDYWTLMTTSDVSVRLEGWRVQTRGLNVTYFSDRWGVIFASSSPAVALPASPAFGGVSDFSTAGSAIVQVSVTALL